MQQCLQRVAQRAVRHSSLVRQLGVAAPVSRGNWQGSHKAAAARCWSSTPWCGAAQRQQQDDARRGTAEEDESPPTTFPASGRIQVPPPVAKEQDTRLNAGDQVAEQRISRVVQYFSNWKGVKDAPRPPRPALSFSLFSGAASFVGISALSAAHFGMLDHMLPLQDTTLLIGSFGATASLVFGVPAAPFSQPRNVIGGHVLSALVGVTAHQLVSPEYGAIVAGPLAVAGAVMIMEQTRTMHPPAAATALIAVLGSEAVWAMGYWYALAPAAVGSSVLVAVGVLVNNLSSKRRYPHYWW